MMCALLMVGMTTLAQEGKPMKVASDRQMTSEQREENQLKKLTSELNLDAAQQNEMSVILGERADKRDAVKAERKANQEKGAKPTAEEREKRRAEMDAFRAEQDAKIKKVLKGDQLVKWEKMKEAQKIRKDKLRTKGEQPQKAE